MKSTPSLQDTAVDVSVRWTRGAFESLGLIAAYIAQDNAARASQFAQALREKTRLLAEFPAIGRPGRVMGTRELVAHKNYIIAYRVRGTDVEIIRIQHVAKRWPTTFD